MARQNRVGKLHTTITTEFGMVRVTYHSTIVVSFNPEMIILNTGGYFTATTKTRMNQASNQFDLGFKVFQRAGQWYATFKGEEHKFDGNKLELLRH